MAAEPVILVEKSGELAVVTLNRPQAMNALSRELRAAIAETFDDLEADPKIRVAILTGAGKAFCAGPDLKELGAETHGAETPPRVEMRLRQEFRTKHKTLKTRRAAVILGWGLATAATLFFAFSLVSWRHYQSRNLVNNQPQAVQTGAVSPAQFTPSQDSTSTRSDVGAVLVASNDSGDFTLLPDSMPPAPEDTTVVRVEMQRAALGALGLTVNEEHAGDWIQVDLLIGDDGLPDRDACCEDD